MGRFQNILEEVLDRIKRSQGEMEVKKVYEELKEVGKEAMSRELICQIIDRKFTPQEREDFLARHPELRTAYENRLEKQ